MLFVKYYSFILTFPSSLLQIFTFPTPWVIYFYSFSFIWAFYCLYPFLLCMRLNKGRFWKPKEKGELGWWQIKQLLPLRSENERRGKSSQEAVLANVSISGVRDPYRWEKDNYFFFVLKKLVAVISDISWSFNISERYHHFWKYSFYFFFSCRLLVEKIFAQYLVPHNLETEERMKCLYYLYASLDPNAVKWV